MESHDPYVFHAWKPKSQNLRIRSEKVYRTIEKTDNMKTALVSRESSRGDVGGFSKVGVKACYPFKIEPVFFIRSIPAGSEKKFFT